MQMQIPNLGDPATLLAKVQGLPPKIYSARQLADHLYSDIDAFVSNLPLPHDPQVHALARNMVVREGAELAFLKLAIATLDHLGIERAPGIQFGGGLSVSLNGWRAELYNRLGVATDIMFRARFSPDEKLKPLVTNERELRLFPAEFYVFASLKEGVGKYSLELCLPDKELREIKRNLRSVGGLEGNNSFATLELMITRGAVFVSRWESKLMTRLADAKLRAQYRDWAHLHLIAAKFFVADLYIRGAEYFTAHVPRLLVPTAHELAAMSTKGEKQGEKLTTSVPHSLRHCYDLVPKNLGFTLTAIKDLPTEQLRKGLQSPVNPGLSKFWTLDVLSELELKAMRLLYKESAQSGEVDSWLLDQSRAPLAHGDSLAKYRPYLDRISEIEARRWIKAYEDLFPASLFLQDFSRGVAIGHQSDLSVSLNGIDQREVLRSGGFAVTPTYARSGEKVARVTKAMADLQSELLEAPSYKLAMGSLSSEVGFISKGSDQGVSGAWWDIDTRRAQGWHLVPLHNEGQNRHPVLRFVYHDKDGVAQESISLGCKGAGLRELDPSLINPPLSLFRDCRLPIYRHRMFRPGEYVPTTHEYWGGASRAELETEYCHSLALIQGVHKVDKSLHAPVALPVDILTPIEIPLWRDGVEERYSQPDYHRKVLGKGEPDFKLGIFRSLSTSDVRFAALIDRVLLSSGNHGSDLERCQEQIDAAMRYLYWVHGKELILPHRELTPTKGVVGPSEVLRYLLEIAHQNPSGAVEIRDSILRPLAATVGIVHGAGGHLGGAHLRHGEIQFGATNGGPLALRNLDLSGTMHDVDGNTMLPWAFGVGLGEEWEDSYRLKYQQLGDLYYLRDTQYWVDRMLYGEIVPTGTLVTEYSPIGVLNPIHRIGKLEKEIVRLKPDGWQIRSAYRPCPEQLLVNSDLHSTYLEYFERGRALRRD